MAIAGSHSSTHRAPLAPFVILAVLVAAVFAQWIPHNLQSFLRYDSGIFLYVGEQLRHGSALYRDVWDHKPPLIFYFNELGLAAANGSAAGVFVLAYLFVAAFFLLVYHETSRLFENGVALLSTCLGLLLFL